MFLYASSKLGEFQIISHSILCNNCGHGWPKFWLGGLQYNWSYQMSLTYQYTFDSVLCSLNVTKSDTVGYK